MTRLRALAPLLAALIGPPAPGFGKAPEGEAGTARLAIGGEFAVAPPEGWAADDQWFRQVPYAEFRAGGDPPERRLSVERYRKDDPLRLTPKMLIANLGDDGAAPKTLRRRIGRRTVSVYQVERRPPPPRRPDADEDFEALGPGKPGIRSKLERCKARGAWPLLKAYANARGDPERLELFRRIHLGVDRQRGMIAACLGPQALGAMEQGLPAWAGPEPDEAEIARLERLEREPAAPQEVQAVSIVEDKDRFYVLRFTASTAAYQAGLPLFDAFLRSFRILEP